MILYGVHVLRLCQLSSLLEPYHRLSERSQQTKLHIEGVFELRGLSEMSILAWKSLNTESGGAHVSS